jgi:penicillin-binding protein 1A
LSQRTRLRSSRRFRQGRRLRAAATGLLLVLAVVGLTGTLGTLWAVNYYAGRLPSIDTLAAANLSQGSRIYDRNGTLLATIYTENRTVVPLKEISPNLQKATIATEDRTFYQHQGVDYRRVAIALVYDATHSSTALGGSTITQQVIKNDLLTDQAQAKTLDRKVKELLLAEEMERRYTKDQILELYLNSIFYGNNSWGAEAAAQTYFGEHASELSLAEGAFLAGLPQRPTAYNPFGTPEQKQAAKARWRTVLDSMVAAGQIKSSQADAAFVTDIWAKMTTQHSKTGSGHDPVTAHFIDYVRDYLVDRYGQAVYQGGLQVTTTLDLPAQQRATELVRNGVKEMKDRGANTGALLAMDPRDGEVIAMVGSADYDDKAIRGQVNLTGVNKIGTRGPGSSFKVYTYGAALEAGAITTASQLDDQNDIIDGHKFYDWDARREGYIPLRQALVESRNLPALWTYKNVGSQRVIPFARKLGITTEIANQQSVATTLGVDAVAMSEHLSAYSAFANGGYKVTPHPILKVTDASGRVLESFDHQPSKERAISPELAYLMTDILKGVPQHYANLGSRPVAAKTGTTESWTGSYWVGYSPDIAVSTYVAHIDAGDQCKSGFANLASGFDPSGYNCPMAAGTFAEVSFGPRVWKPFMESWYSNHQWPKDWDRPAGIVQKDVCDTHGRPTGRQELFIKGMEQNCTPPPPSPVPSPSPSPTPSPSPATGSRTGSG